MVHPGWHFGTLMFQIRLCICTILSESKQVDISFLQAFIINGFDGNDIGMLKLFLLLYADDIVLLIESEIGFQQGLDILKDIVIDENFKLIKMKLKC